MNSYQTHAEIPSYQYLLLYHCDFLLHSFSSLSPFPFFLTLHAPSFSPSLSCWRPLTLPALHHGAFPWCPFPSVLPPHCLLSILLHSHFLPLSTGSTMVLNFTLITSLYFPLETSFPSCPPPRFLFSTPLHSNFLPFFNGSTRHTLAALTLLSLHHGTFPMRPFS